MRKRHPAEYPFWALFGFEFGRWVFAAPATPIDVYVFACVLMIIFIWNESRSSTQE